MYETIRSKPYFTLLRRALFIGAFTWLIYITLSQVSSVDLSLFVFSQALVYSTVILGLLAYINLTCETMKWVSLLPVKLQFNDAFRAVLAGMYSGFFTPNRIGEFTGRMVLVETQLRLNATSATFLGSFVQAVVTVIFGFLSLSVLTLPSLDLHLEQNFVPSAAVLSLIVIVLFSFGGRLYKFVRSYLIGIKESMLATSSRQLLRAFSWALLRYLVFSTQLVLAMNVVGFDGSVLEAYACVSLLFLLQTYFPFAIGGETGVREVLAVLIFTPFLAIPVNAALATLMVWFANIVIPVLVGSFIFNKALKESLIQS